MFMRIGLILGILLSFTVQAENPLRCTLSLRPAGIYFSQCPPRMLADGVDVWAPHPGPYPQVRVKCVRPEIICNQVKKDLQKEIN